MKAEEMQLIYFKVTGTCFKGNNSRIKKKYFHLSQLGNKPDQFL